MSYCEAIFSSESLVADSVVHIGFLRRESEEHLLFLWSFDPDQCRDIRFDHAFINE